MMRRRMLTVAAALAIMISTLATAAGEVTFGYQFTPGKSEKYRLKISTDMEMTGMQASQLANMAVTVACGSRKGDAYAMAPAFDKGEAAHTNGRNTAPDPNTQKM